MKRTFFLEAAAPARKKTTPLKESFKTINESTAQVGLALTESEIAYKDILIESMQMEAQGILNEDAKGVGGAVKNFFEKMVTYFTDLAKKVTDYLRTAWASVKNFFKKTTDWFKTKSKTIRANMSKRSNEKLMVRLGSKYKNGLPSIKQVVTDEVVNNPEKALKAFQAAFNDGEGAKKDGTSMEITPKMKKIAYQNLENGGRFVSVMEKNFKGVIGKAQEGLKEAKKGLSEVDKGDSNKVLVARGRVNDAKKRVAESSKAATKSVRYATAIIKDSAKICRTFGADNAASTKREKEMKKQIKGK